MASFTELDIVFLVLQNILISSLFFYLGIRSFCRKWYLSEAADQTTHFYTKSFKAKIILNGLIFIYYLSAILYLTLFDQSSILATVEYVVLIPMISVLLEADLLIFQYLRRIPSKYYIHALSWICLTFCSLITAIIYIFLDDTDSEQHSITEHRTINICLSFSQVALFLTRTTLQLVFPQDEEHLSYTSTDHRRQFKSAEQSEITDLIPKNSLKRSLLGDRPKKQLGEFSVSIKSAKQIDGQYHFQINISSANRTFKTFKTYPEFAELHEILLDHTIQGGKSLELPRLGALQSSNVSNAIMQLQRYVDNILNIFDPIPDSVLNFLKVVREDKRKQDLDVSLQKIQLNKVIDRSVENDIKLTLNNNGESLESITEEEMRKKAPSVSNLESNHCPYITVTLVDAKIPADSKYFEYKFNLALSDNPEDNWFITKRYKEFSQLVDTLSRRKVNLPKLPPARLMKSHKVIEERKVELTNFLRILLNEEIYLRFEEITNFVKLSKNAQAAFFQNREKCDFSRWWVRIIEDRVKILPNNVAVTEFVILVHPDSTTCNSPNYKLYKRMLDFENLHTALTIRFGKEGLPQLPAKFNAFFSQTTVEFRMTGLENFLNAVFAIPKIEDCYSFRKFLNPPMSEPKKDSRASSTESIMIPESRSTSNVLAPLSQKQSGIDFDPMRESLQAQTDTLRTIHQIRQVKYDL